jgi:hypothetical protein
MVPINRRSAKVSAQYKQQHRGAIGRHNKMANCLRLARVPSVPASMHTCALIVARVPPVELGRVIEDCSILTEHSLKRVAAYRSHNDRSPVFTENLNPNVMMINPPRIGCDVMAPIR